MKISISLIIIFILSIANIDMSLADTELPTPTPSISPTPVTTDTTSTISGLASSTVLSVSLANLDPNPPIAGEIVDIRIGIENIGGTAIKNLKIEIVPEYPFELVPGENAVKDVGIIEGYRSYDTTANLKIIKYKIKINKDAPAGSYELRVKYYEQGSSDKFGKNLYIDIKSRSNVEVIHIDKTTLIPGKQSELKFKINNVGNAPLRDVMFNWENKDNVILPVGSDNTRYIKYIDINEGFDLGYQVIADTSASPGLYKMNLYLTYTDSINGTTRQLSTIAGVYVGGGTDFDISFSEIADGETSFSVANIGSNPAYAVLVVVPNQKGWKVSSSDSIMIGNLNSGDYTVASFKLHKDTNSSSNLSKNPYKIVMKIDYTDTMGERRLIDKEVKLGNIDTTNEETTKKERQGDPILLIVVVIILIFLTLVYRKYRRLI